MVGSAPSSSRKRKSEGPKFYAVKAGHTTGVKLTWDDCKESITGYKGAICESIQLRYISSELEPNSEQINRSQRSRRPKTLWQAEQCLRQRVFQATSSMA